MISPPPYSTGKGGAGGYAPSPHTASVSRVGGDTPDCIFPPLQAEGNTGSPLEGSRIQILHCRGLPVENNQRAAPCGHTQPPRLATPPRPPQSCGSGLWRSYEWPGPPGLGSRRSHRARRPGKTSLEREVGRGCCTPPSSFPWSCRPSAQPIGTATWPPLP